MGKEAIGKQDTVSLDHIPLVESHIEYFEGDERELKDFLFNEYMKQQLLENFFEELSDFVFDEKDVDEMKRALTEFESDEIISALSLPHELRERMFQRMQTEIEGGVSPIELMRNFVSKSAKYGFGIGFHTSPKDLRPAEDGSWTIKGTEKDHRDDDRMMAYYSTRYEHLYKKKHPKFVYIIRTDPSTHKTDGNWSRADSLSVVARVPFEDVSNYVEQLVKEKRTTEAGEQG